METAALRRVAVPEDSGIVMTQDGDPDGALPVAADLHPVTYSPRTFIEADDVPRVLFLIPGSKSLAQWCIDVRSAADREQWGVDVRIAPYLPPSLWQVVLFPLQFRRRLQVKRQLDRMFKELPHHAELFMAAHSFGTDVLTHWLRDHVKVVHCVQDIFRVQRRIHGIVLINGIAKRKYLADVRDACNVLINDVAVKDRLPSWAAGLASWAYDDIGTRGIVTGSARPTDRYFEGDHATLVSVDHFRENILPIILGQGVPPGTRPGPEIPELHQSRVRTLRNWFLLLAAAAGVALWINGSSLAAAMSDLCARSGVSLCAF